MSCRIVIEGRLPRGIGVDRAALRRAAACFAAKAAARARIPFREVAVVLQDDAFSAVTHAAINGADGPTDVTTQRYDAMPGEADGVYGADSAAAVKALQEASGLEATGEADPETQAKIDELYALRFPEGEA